MAKLETKPATVVYNLELSELELQVLLAALGPLDSKNEEYCQAIMSVWGALHRGLGEQGKRQTLDVVDDNGHSASTYLVDIEKK